MFSTQHSKQNYAPVQVAVDAPTVKNVTGQKNDINGFQNFTIQTKLPVGTVDSALELEADAMADKVMTMPETDFIQRKCAHCEEEEKLQRKPLIPFIQKKESVNFNVASDDISNQIQSTKGNGMPMPETTKSFMESRFGTGFSNVRIHSDNNASRLSNELNAKAFTIGNDIYFKQAQYAPEKTEGKRLL